MLLNAALKEYLLECELRNYTEKTIKGYRNSIELLVNYLQQNGITDVDEVLAPHIKHFLTNLQRAGRKPSYINGLHKAFRAWFKYLQEEEYVSANPMNKIGWAKEEKNRYQNLYACRSTSYAERLSRERIHGCSQ